jgi:hypothetical protein
MDLTPTQQAIADGMAAIKANMIALEKLMQQQPAPAAVITTSALSVHERNALDIEVALAAVMYAVNSVDGLHVRVTSKAQERLIIIELLPCDFNV